MDIDTYFSVRVQKRIPPTQQDVADLKSLLRVKEILNKMKVKSKKIEEVRKIYDDKIDLLCSYDFSHLKKRGFVFQYDLEAHEVDGFKKTILAEALYFLKQEHVSNGKIKPHTSVIFLRSARYIKVRKIILSIIRGTREDINESEINNQLSNFANMAINETLKKIR